MANKSTKTAKAENTEKAKTNAETRTGKVYTENEMQEAVNAAVAAAMEKMKAEAPPVITLAKEENVVVLFIGAIARGTSVGLGKLGQITRSGGMLEIPKKDFLQSLGSPVVDALLRKRQLLVIDGLTPDEMERFGLAYKESEVLSQNAFFKLFDYPKKEIEAIYAALCDEHKKIVAKMYLTQYFEAHDNRVTPEIVKSLNKLSKTVYSEGLFSPILEDMAKKFTTDEE